MVDGSPEYATFSKIRPPKIIDDRPETDFEFLRWLLPRQRLLGKLVAHDLATRSIKMQQAGRACTTLNDPGDAFLRHVDAALIKCGLHLYCKFKANGRLTPNRPMPMYPQHNAPEPQHPHTHANAKAIILISPGGRSWWWVPEPVLCGLGGSIVGAYACDLFGAFCRVYGRAGHIFQRSCQAFSKDHHEHEAGRLCLGCVRDISRSIEECGYCSSR